MCGKELEVRHFPNLYACMCVDKGRTENFIKSNLDSHSGDVFLTAKQFEDGFDEFLDWNKKALYSTDDSINTANKGCTYHIRASPLRKIIRLIAGYFNKLI